MEVEKTLQIIILKCKSDTKYYTKKRGANFYKTIPS